MERNVKRKTNWTESLIGVQHDAGVPLTAPFSFCCFREEELVIAEKVCHDACTSNS